MGAPVRGTLLAARAYVEDEPGKALGGSVDDCHHAPITLCRGLLQVALVKVPDGWQSPGWVYPSVTSGLRPARHGP